MAVYAQLAEKHVNPCARDLLLIMGRKRTNLCVSVDVTTKKELLEIADKTGPYICLLKTHIDIISDYDSTIPEQLTTLAQKHSFVIFEDRKFADIGNTVKLQYSSGIYNIASWAHITNAHIIPGEGIISGLKEVGAPLGRGLLLLAEMSSKGTLATGTYTERAVAMAKKHSDFVIGFIAMGRLASLEENDNFIIMTPGVGFGGGGDKLGQQYKDPSDAILGGSDIIIVGRGIYGDGKDVVVEAQKYQDAGWNAYLERTNHVE